MERSSFSSHREEEEGSWLDSISPISPGSRLLKPINRVRVRIPSETLERTSKESERIAEKTSLANHQTKSRVLGDLHNRLKVNQQQREKQVNAWIQKTRNCPYRLDQNEVDMRAMERGKERNQRKKKSRQRQKLLASMTGEPNMEFYSDTLKNSLTTEQLLAMEHLTLLKTMNKLKEEQDHLTEMLHHDCEETELKFAHIAMKRSYDRAKARTASVDLQSMNSSSFAPMSAGGELSSANSLAWGRLSAPKVEASRARQWKKMDNTVYAADGKWNESGQFVPARKPEDKLGLMSSKYARITGDSAPEILTRRRKTDIFKMEMTSS